MLENKSKSKILVIDDEEILTKTFARLLEKHGYEVFIATHPQDAIALAEEMDFDLILCDIRMPGQNGVETARQIRAKQDRERIPIIFLTGYADEDQEREAQELKPIAYLIKPFDAFHLLRLIHSQFSNET